MVLLSLNLRERPPLYPKRQLPPAKFRLNSVDLNRGIVPFRGLSYSFLFHNVALFSALFLPVLADYYRTPPMPIGDQLFAIDLNHKAKLVYFPNLPAKDENEQPKTEPKRADRSDAPAKPPALRTQGLTYPGQEAVVSDVPNPTNKFQTLLQPAVVNPPVMRMPRPLPNILQMADAGPLPMPEPPKPELTVAKKDLAVPSPSQVTPQKTNVVLPNVTAAPTLAVPERPVEPPTPLRKDLSVPAPTLTASRRPDVVLPLGPATPAVAIPEKPIELTAVKKDLTVPLPANAAPTQRANIALPSANAAPSLPAPERPLEPPTALRKDLSVPAPSQVESQRPNVLLPRQASAPAVAAPEQIAAVENHGPDRQNLLSISPLPAPALQGDTLPAAEARGRFAIIPDPNLRASGAVPGVTTDDLPNRAAGVGNKTDGVSGNVASGSGASAGATNGGTGTPKDGSSKDAGNTSAKNPFSGITVQGGKLQGTGVASAAASSPSTLTIGSSAGGSAAGPTAYGMTVVANAGTGGGLPDLGVFAKEQVFTVYIDMKNLSGFPAPAWTLQYAPIPATPNLNGLVPPFPITKSVPLFLTEVVQKNPRAMVIVYAIINAQGKLQQLSVKQTPDDRLNDPALTALSKWTFRPAEANGHPVAVKVLFGIPISPK